MAPRIDWEKEAREGRARKAGRVKWWTGAPSKAVPARVMTIHAQEFVQERLRPSTVVREFAALPPEQRGSDLFWEFAARLNEYFQREEERLVRIGPFGTSEAVRLERSSA